MPAVVAHAQLLSSQVAVAVVWTPAVVLTVGDVTGFALPVLVTLTVYPAGDGAARRALAMSRAVVGTGVNAAQEGERDQTKDTTGHRLIIDVRSDICPPGDAAARIRTSRRC